MSELDHAWAAGFIDGDGYIYARQQGPRNGRRGGRPEVGVSAYQIVREPLEKLQQLYGGHIMWREPQGVGRKGGWTWRVHGGVATRATLTALLPYLVLKRAQAEHVLVVANTIPAKGKRA